MNLVLSVAAVFRSNVALPWFAIVSVPLFVQVAFIPETVAVDVEVDSFAMVAFVFVRIAASAMRNVVLP